VVVHGRVPSDDLPTPMIRSAIGFVAPAFAARSAHCESARDR
jgi:hypothetical protein